MTNMDSRIDTSSGRFRGQWAFLSNRPQHDRPRSIPASSYLRSDPSSASPISSARQSHSLNASRWSLPRNFNSSSAGGYTSSTQPSQPVLVRVHSADASAHLRPGPRIARRRLPMNNNDELPPVHEYSIDGILAAIEEDIEDDINAIAEILGRNRLVLADQRDSHLPPQGIIRGVAGSLQVVEEGSGSNEALTSDDVLIVHEDASLAGGSNSGSAAYNLLERLKAIPPTAHLTSSTSPSGIAPRPFTPLRSRSLPIVPTDPDLNDTSLDPLTTYPRYPPHNLLQRSTNNQQPSKPAVTDAKVSETYLLAGTNGTTLSDPPVVHEGDRYYPLYSYDERDVFDVPSTAISSSSSLTERIQRVLFLSKMQNFFLNKKADAQDQNVPESKAVSRLRGILGRNPTVPSTVRENGNLAEIQDLYE